MQLQGQHVLILGLGASGLAMARWCAQAGADALALAQRWALSPWAALWIDTAPKPEPLAQALARSMGAHYLPMPYVQAQRMAAAMQTLRGA